MENIQEITLDIKDNHTYQQLYTKQYDYGSSIIFHIVNDGCPFDIEGVTAIFSLKNPTGTLLRTMQMLLMVMLKLQLRSR